MIPTFAYHVQLLLVNYIHDVLSQSGTADWLRTWWTGVLCGYCLAHEGYDGSNKKLGAEVDWRDLKYLVPASATISTFTGSHVKFVSDIGIKHHNFLKPTDSLFLSKAVLTKRIYNQLQDFPRHTLLYTIVMAVSYDTTLRKWEDIIDSIDCSIEED